MARISDSNPKNSSDSYSRLFGNDELGALITKIQSTVISSGTELERMINSHLKDNNQLVTDLDTFLNKKSFLSSDFRVIPKRAFKKSKFFEPPTQEPDFVVLKIENLKKHCYIIELKDGYTFDTKKASGEKNSLKEFEAYIATKIPYTTSIHICSFNQLDKKLIKTGFKNKFTDSEILNGKEFCDLLFINYKDITSSRLLDQNANIDYFINEVLKIKALKQRILIKLKQGE